MKIKEILSIGIQTLVITALVLLAVIPFSCKVTEEGIEIIGGDYTSPCLTDIVVVDGSTLNLVFTERVKMSSLVISEKINGISNSDYHSESDALSPALAVAVGEYGEIEASVEYQEDNGTVIVNLQKPTEIGKEYEIFGVVEDRIGNTLTFTAPFSGYNSRIPKIIMTEVQIKYGKGSSGGEAIYRGEYVELLALEDGNLIGLELFSASDGEKKKYHFPNIDVHKGEILLVHLRTVGEGCVNETFDLDEATAPHSKNGIRDLWDDNTTARFNDNSDVIILRNRVNGSIMDGIMYSSIDAVEWKNGIADYAIELQQSGIYSSWEIDKVSSSKGCTTLRSLTRNNAQEIYEMIMSEEEYEYPIPVNEEDWIVDNVSPGIF